jgi:hypothetical protein
MFSTRSMAGPVLWSLLLASWTYAQDLSSYREFRFGMNLSSITEQTGMRPSDAKTIHQRPAVIQELEWRPASQFGSAALRGGSVRELVFSFYNGELFQIVVNYDRSRTEGLTDEDMVAAISTKYGHAKKPAAETIRVSISEFYHDDQQVIARWEDAQYSFTLYRSPHQRLFGMVLFPKGLNALARGAVAEAIRLNRQEAPQREIERQQQHARESRAADEKARLLNKATFRP